MKLLIGAASLAALTIVATAAGAAPAVTLTSPGDLYSGAPYTLGFSFTVAGTQSISALGVFDENSDGLNGDADVGLWDTSGDLLASVVVPAGTAGTLDGSFRYAPITPYRLTPGVTYIVGAYAPSDNASSIGTGQGGTGFVNPNVTIIQDQFSYNGTFYFPNSSDGYGGGAWLGANFELGVPEPSSWAVILVGLGAVGGLMRWRGSLASA